MRSIFEEVEPINRDRYLEIVRGFTDRHVVVIGDLMMDEYLWGRATRISQEGPVMIVEIERETSVPGGAANVVSNLLALGATVSVIGVVGDDPVGQSLIEAIHCQGADVRGVVIDSSRTTTRKTRIVAHNQQVLRVDREQNHGVPHEIAVQLMERLEQSLADAGCVIISDYNKGVITPEFARSAVNIVRGAGRLLMANPKPRNARALANADMLQLNQGEAEATSRDERFQREEELADAGAALMLELQVERLIVTQGSRGLSIWQQNGHAFHVPVHPVEVYDPAGAGDTVISALSLGLVAGANIQEAAIVANHAAACVVRKVGVATVTREELLADWQSDDSRL